jgi:HipA-like C-terminal domain
VRETFPIILVAREMRSEVEQLGSKPKFWFRLNRENWLFKEARVNTGEDWSEKVASEIAGLLGLPTHRAELADYEGKRGCAVRSFLSGTQSGLVHGNELLGGLITGYDKDKVHGQADHTFDNIVRVVQRLFTTPGERRNAALQVAGYVVLDALVGNTDRHHQNWGVMVTPSTSDSVVPPQLSLQVAPTFDHASSLGRELSDEACERHLCNGTIRRYIQKARGGIFANAGAKHGLSPVALAQLLANRYPDLFAAWRARVEDFDLRAVEEITAAVPESRMSTSSRAFALAQITESRKIIIGF